MGGIVLLRAPHDSSILIHRIVSGVSGGNKYSQGRNGIGVKAAATAFG